MELLHHGAAHGVTGSCHELQLNPQQSLLIDCGLLQGEDARREGDAEHGLSLHFDCSTVQALLVTHCHIDHVGRIPALLAAGYRGPIYATAATARLLPLVLEDALQVAGIGDRALSAAVLNQLKRQLVAVDYGGWQVLPVPEESVQVRFQPAGHILGSAFIELQVNDTRLVFSGDLGASNSPLLPAPISPGRADWLIIESTYGDKLHEARRERHRRLRQVCENSLRNGGTTLIPAFSIGRTQELLYEFEQILYELQQGRKSGGHRWQGIPVIVDSPLAAQFTQHYRQLKTLWDAEARRKVLAGRHPLAFDGLYTIGSHQQHLALVNRLAQTGEPAIVIAASGMCAGGRMQNYLKALLGDKRTDVLFVGYQAQGTPGRDIQRFGPRGGYVELDNQRYPIRASVHTLGGYSAHADAQGLVDFVTGIRQPPQVIRIVHGEPAQQLALADRLRQAGVESELQCACLVSRELETMA